MARDPVVPQASPSAAVSLKSATFTVAGTRGRSNSGCPAQRRSARSIFGETSGALMLVTPRLMVRRLTIDDVESFHHVWGDPDVIFWDETRDIDESRSMLERVVERRLDGMDESGWFGVFRVQDMQFVGDVILQPASWDCNLAEVGWHLSRACQRRGYATEAAAALLDHAARGGVAEVWAKLLPTNDASRRVAMRLDMVRSGYLDHPLGEHELWRKVLVPEALR